MREENEESRDLESFVENLNFGKPFVFLVSFVVNYFLFILCVLKNDGERIANDGMLEFKDSPSSIPSRKSPPSIPPRKSPPSIPPQGGTQIIAPES
jgi:hypothetical protein